MLFRSNWCSRNVPHSISLVNGALPPLPYEACSFDLVFGISIFTHLSEHYQTAWIPELHRILKPGGLLLLSFHAKHVWQPLDESGVIQQGELVFRSSRKLKGILPDWYQTVFQNSARVVGMLSRYFPNVNYLERGLGDQDLAVAWESRSPSLVGPLENSGAVNHPAVL